MKLIYYWKSINRAAIARCLLLYMQCMNNWDGYELMHIAIYPSHWYAEWRGHTLGFKAAGSLSVHTTVAVWNAYHAWKIRAKTQQCMKGIWNIKTFILYTCLQVHYEHGKKQIKKYVEFESHVSLFLFGSNWSQKVNKQSSCQICDRATSFLAFLGEFSFCLFESVVLYHCHMIVVKRSRMYWKWVWCPAVTTSFQTMIKWTICAVVWIESFIPQWEIRPGRHLWSVRK